MSPRQGRAGTVAPAACSSAISGAMSPARRHASGFRSRALADGQCTPYVTASVKSGRRNKRLRPANQPHPGNGGLTCPVELSPRGTIRSNSMSKTQKATDRIQADTRDALEEAWNPSSGILWPSPNVIAPSSGRRFRRRAPIGRDLAQNAGVAFAVIMRAASDAAAEWASSQNPQDANFELSSTLCGTTVH
jgi:hypothetical protein